MATTKYPGAIDDSSSMPNPGSGDFVVTVDHAGQHDVINDAAKAIEAKLGITASTPTANKVLRATGVGTSVWQQVNAASDVTGTLPVANGGSGVTTSTGTGNNVLSNSPTLSAPSFTSISNTGTLTLPTLTDTLVGRATTDTLTNKSIDGGTNTLTNIPASALATSAIFLGYSQIITNFTTANTSSTQIPGLSVSVIIPAGSRRVKITGFCRDYFNNTNSSSVFFTIWDGTVGSGTQLGQALGLASGGVASSPVFAVVTPSAGAKTYNLGLHTAGSGTAQLEAGSGYPAFILVEAI